MRIEIPRPRRRYPESALSLVNIVFLLLIFFMVAGRIDAQDPLPVEPPRVDAAEGMAAEPGTILLAADGRLAFEGRIVSEDELLDAVATPARDAAAPPLRLKADGTVEALAVVALLARLRAAGVEGIELVATGTGR